MTFKIEISGFTSQAQAEQFAQWYNHQGEQYICDWLECRHQEGKVDCTSLNVDLLKTLPLKWADNTLKIKVSPH